MNKLAFLLLLLLACPVQNAAGQQSGGLKVSVQGAIKPEWRQPLTNESIMGLVKMGFSDETILAMIEHEDGKYSLAPVDVIALREAGVSEKVIRAMLSKSASDQAATSHTPVTQTPAQATATLGEGLAQNQNNATRMPSVGSDLGFPAQPGLYAVIKGGQLERIEGRVTSFVRSGSRLASTVTLGIHADRVNTQIPGSHASVTVSPTPTFYYRPVQDEGGLDLILTRLTVKNGRRQFEIGAEGAWRKSTGVSVRHQLDFDAKQIEPELYRVVFTHELEAGQYAFYLLRGREHASVYEGSGFVYCFQVE
jgi:hypothetical protein